MRLCYSPTSPFVRKVVVVALETGQRDAIRMLDLVPGETPGELEELNPLGKIPSLILDDGGLLYDSRTICEYLDSRHRGRKLFPDLGPGRWTVLTRLSLADGIADAALLRRYEALRPEQERSPGWDQRQRDKVVRSLDHFERQEIRQDLDIGSIALAIALDYLDFRFAHDTWRIRRPRLAEWHAAFSRRPSLSETRPG